MHLSNIIFEHTNIIQLYIYIQILTYKAVSILNHQKYKIMSKIIFRLNLCVLKWLKLKCYED